MIQHDLITAPSLNHSMLRRLAQKHGASFFVLDAVRFRANFRSLHAAFQRHYPKVELAYSYKTNYTPHLCRIAHEEGGFAEVVSEMEYAAAKRLNIPTDRIIYNGPFKSEWSFIEAAHGGAIINLDSAREIALLRQAAQSNPTADIRVVLRMNFDISSSVSRFGFDPEGADFGAMLHTIRDLANVRLLGLHCHFPDRTLESFRIRAQSLIDLMPSIFPDGPPELLNIGGGYFSNMPESMRLARSEPPATFDDYGEAVGKILSQAMQGEPRWPTLFLEPGTAVVADCQTFYTEVISTRSVRGEGFATVAGSIFDISPNARCRTLPVEAILDPGADRSGAHPEPAVVGYTCIEGDRLTDKIPVPLVAGDYLSYENVGSYSVVMRPPFILPSNPVLLYEDESQPLRLIKERQSNEDVFSLFRN
jgi:diaminopimelate decarboxylase